MKGNAELVPMGILLKTQSRKCRFSDKSKRLMYRLQWAHRAAGFLATAPPVPGRGAPHPERADITRQSIQPRRHCRIPTLRPLGPRFRRFPSVDVWGRANQRLAARGFPEGRSSQV